MPELLMVSCLILKAGVVHASPCNLFATDGTQSSEEEYASSDGGAGTYSHYLYILLLRHQPEMCLQNQNGQTMLITQSRAPYPRGYRRGKTMMIAQLARH